MTDRAELMNRFFQLTLGLLCTARRNGNVFENMNPAWERTLGWTREELCSRSFVEFVHPDDLARTAELIATMDEGQPAVHFENRYRHKNGSWVWLSWVGILVDGTYYSSAIDISANKRDAEEKRALVEALVTKERLAVLGQLAGGMAHELRHPLGVVKNAAYFLNMVLDNPTPKVKETLQILEREVATSERIIQSLLDFAAPKPPRREKVALPQLVQAQVEALEVPANVEVVLDVAAALPTVLADPRHLEQVLRNILVNALQAMSGVGQLTVRLSTNGDGAVQVTVTDTGPGIAAEHLPRIFEPLFTTKSKGIGLGLALAKLLVEAHGGTIAVDSERGKGATLTVRLPAPGARGAE
jgi:PAS domain S-box-containing protein